MKDFFPIRGFDHLELHVGNAKQGAAYYAACFGFETTAYRGLETGSRDCASYVLEQGEIRLVLTTALGPDHPVARGVQLHGDCVAAIDHQCVTSVARARDQRDGAAAEVREFELPRFRNPRRRTRASSLQRRDERSRQRIAARVAHATSHDLRGPAPR